MLLQERVGLSPLQNKLDAPILPEVLSVTVRNYRPGAAYSDRRHSVLVDAKDDEARDFYKHFGFIELPEQDLKLFLPIETVKQLF